MLQSFSRKIESLIPCHAKVALAVSGGIDSICMTLLFSQISFVAPIVLIVDHKLRKESSAETLYVKNYITEKFNFQVHILPWERDYDVSSNVQSQARDARYKLLIEQCKRLEVEYLCTAHNKNDNAETVLMNIMRGSGIDGLIGIRENSILDKVHLLRPILDFTRDSIMQYLVEHNIVWVEDPSNQDERYERVKIRRFITEISRSNLVNAKDFVSRLNLLSDNALRTHQFISKYVDEKIKQICRFFPIDLIIVNADKLFVEDCEIALRILRILIKFCGRGKNYVRRKSLLILYNLFIECYKENKYFNVTLGGVVIWCCADKNAKLKLVITKEKYNVRDFTAKVVIETGFVRKNEVAKLKKILMDSTSPKLYEIVDQNVYHAILEIIDMLPKVHRFLCGTPYYCTSNNGIIKCFYPTLGIFKILP